MPDNQQIFYTSISKYYPQIFPYRPVQLHFVKQWLPDLSHRMILDIGCATGELAFQLAVEGAVVKGIDLNENLLSRAIKNKSHTNLIFQKGNMLELETDFKPSFFDAVLCFGNTLVHLQSKELIQQMLRASYKVLKPGGKLLLQILNYDYILDEMIAALPLIETEEIKFIRNYSFNAGSDLIGFQTQLEIKNENRIVSNETPLLALKSADLRAMLEDAGFKKIKLYANFKQDAFGGKHIPLVVACEKI